MKVLIVNTLYPPHVIGGAERSVQELAEALAAQGVEVVVASTFGGRRTTTDFVNGVKVVHLSMANLYWPFDRVARSAALRKLWHLIDIYDPGMQAKLARLIGEESPSIVHTNNLQGISVAAWHAARAARVPTLHTLRDYYLTCARCSRYRNGHNCERTCWSCLPSFLARRQASAAVTGVVGVSRFILDHHRKTGLFANAGFHTVIPHGVSPASVASRPSTSAPRLTFGYLGRLRPEKGVELLLDAFAARRPGGWELLIAGEGDEDDHRRLCQRHATLENRNAIRFLDWTESAEFFAQVDIVIVPSRWQEPSARVVAEAFAHGVPIVAARRGGLPEQIEDGVTGLLFDPDDPAMLGKIIDRILQDRSLSEQLSQTALCRARDNIPEGMAAKYQKAYQAVLGTSGMSAGS